MLSSKLMTSLTFTIIIVIMTITASATSFYSVEFNKFGAGDGDNRNLATLDTTTWDCATCAEKVFTSSCYQYTADDPFFESCYSCGFGSSINSSYLGNCVSCNPPNVIAVTPGGTDGTGACMAPEYVSTYGVTLYSSSINVLPCSQCGFPYHAWSEYTTCTDSLSTYCNTNTSSTTCFSGDSTYHKCTTCGFGSNPTSDSDCLTCESGYEIDVVYSNCTGYCVVEGTAANPIEESSCKMPCAACGVEFDGFVHPNPPTYMPTLLPTPFPTSEPIPQPTHTPSLLPSPLPTHPTSTPTPQPTNVPTVLPTSLPTSEPTPQPTVTFSPSTGTPFPTPVPTSTPTPNPTSSPIPPTLYPTVKPTLRPTPLPSSKPSPGPSQIPSLTPSQLPSFRPSLLPTPSPSILCISGKYVDFDANICVDCPAGKFSSRVAGYPMPNNCTKCPAQSFAATTGSAVCTSCSEGKYSNSARTICDYCQAGQYVNVDNVCTNCSKGTYAPVPLDNSGCLSCAAGFYTNNDGTVTSSAVVDIGATACSKCAEGFYSAYESSSCEFAADKYYLSSDGDAESCPKNADCVGEYQAPVPFEGYWVDRTSSEYMGSIYKCVRSTCVLPDRNPEDKCWATNYSSFISNGYNMDKSNCGSTKLVCSKGAEGILCGSCSDNYIYQAESKTCKLCSGLNNSTLLLFIIVFVICMMIGFVTLFNAEDNRLDDMKKFVKSFDLGSLKVLLVTYQIIMSCSWNLDVKFPEPFSSFLAYLTIFSLDFLSIQCLREGTATARYFFTMYMWCCLPLLFIASIIVVGGIRVSRLKSVVEQDKIKNQHIWMSLLVTYLVLPVVSNKQFQSIDCVSLNDVKLNFLRADTAVNCKSPSYKSFHGTIVMFILIYQSIPIIWLTLLYRNKDQLERKNPNQNEKLELYIRDQNKSLNHLRFLFNNYKTKLWWFEVVEMYRRILFIGILPLTSTVTSKRASFGCYLAIVSLICFREVEPYRHKVTNFIAYAAQSAILITFFTAISIDLGVLMSFGMSDFELGLFLMLCNLSLTIFVIYTGISRFKKYKKKKEGIRAKAEKLEWAIGFSANKFLTTFVSINEASVASTNVLLFHYTSFDLARMAMRSGIAALEQFDGIPFTLRQPHQTGSCENLIFKNHSRFSMDEDSQFPNDVLLVISLPRILLKPLKGYENELYLCCLHVGMLNAIRPMHPGQSVFDVRPWTDGYAMLPPTCILRSYQLVEEPHEEVTTRTSSKSLSQSLSDWSGHGSIINKLSLDTANIQSLFKKQWLYDKPFGNFEMKDVIYVNFVDQYLDYMKQVRKTANKIKMVPLYHYTTPSILNLIVKGGMRMSSQGQADGGVYFSMQGPCSYGLGSEGYEKNIIKDCFGVERMDEYLGKGKLDAIIVYACETDMLVQAPGGRDNAKMVPKSYFTSLMLPQDDGNYFLRPDRILAVFVINQNVEFKNKLRGVEFETEIKLEKELQNDLNYGFSRAEVYAKTLNNISIQLYSNDSENKEKEDKASGDEVDIEHGVGGGMVPEPDLVRLSAINDVFEDDSEGNVANVNGDNEANRVRSLSVNPLFRPPHRQSRNATLDGNPSVLVKENKRYFNVKKPSSQNKECEVEMEVLDDDGSTEI